MSSDYYNRPISYNSDGTPMYQTAEDREHEREVRAILEVKWGCKIYSMGKLAPIDWYALKHERPWAFIELKCSNKPEGQYKDAILNMRKWMWMKAWELTGVPMVVVYRFTDSIRWIRLEDIDPRRIKLGGCSRIVKSQNDRELLIMIPIAQTIKVGGEVPRFPDPPPPIIPETEFDYDPDELELELEPDDWLKRAMENHPLAAAAVGNAD